MANEANIKRIKEIKEQVKALGEEAVRLADEEGVVVSFANTPFANAWGAGGLRYTPDSATHDEWGDEIGEDPWGDERGWKSSASDSC